MNWNCIICSRPMAVIRENDLRVLACKGCGMEVGWRTSLPPLPATIRGQLDIDGREAT